MKEKWTGVVDDFTDALIVPTGFLVRSTILEGVTIVFVPCPKNYSELWISQNSLEEKKPEPKVKL